MNDSKPSSLRPSAVAAWATRVLTAAATTSPAAEARQLLAHCLGCDLGAVVLAADLTPAQLDELSALLHRRATGEPLQYILGEVGFGQVTLSVGPGVFIPRPETELLVEAAARWIRADNLDRPVIVDLCTGSGALAAALAAEFPHAQITAVELDPLAASYAARSFARLEQAADVDLVVGDATDRQLCAALHGQVDVVVTNPPYVPEAQAALVDATTRTYDPHHAVFGGVDGMEVLVELLPVIRTLLRPGGRMWLEHDDATQQACWDAALAAGLTDLIAARDLAGRPRYISAARP